MYGHFANADLDDDGLVSVADAVNRHIGAAQVALLGVIAEIDRRGAWRDSGARDFAHWLSIRYGVSWWKADRWIHAANALHGLPGIAAALEAGTLGIDKVVELSRFATPDTEGELVAWACESTCATIRRRADLEVKAAHEETVEFERNRSLRYWYEDGGRRFGLEARMPSAQGAIVAKALQRVVDQVPVMPAELDAAYIDARRADALLALSSQRIAVDADADRATVVVHAPLEALAGRRNAETEHGAVVPPEALQRMACDARVQVVAENQAGDAVALGRTSREPSASMMRQLRFRDRGCRFPGCGFHGLRQRAPHHGGLAVAPPTSRTCCSSAGFIIGSFTSTVGRWNGSSTARWAGSPPTATGIGVAAARTLTRRRGRVPRRRLMRRRRHPANPPVRCLRHGASPRRRRLGASR